MVTNFKCIAGNNSIFPPVESPHIAMEGQLPALSSSPGACISFRSLYFCCWDLLRRPDFYTSTRVGNISWLFLNDSPQKEGLIYLFVYLFTYLVLLMPTLFWAVSGEVCSWLTLDRTQHRDWIQSRGRLHWVNLVQNLLKVFRSSWQSVPAHKLIF